jgi:hypothetical protein
MLLAVSCIGCFACALAIVQAIDMPAAIAIRDIQIPKDAQIEYLARDGIHFDGFQGLAARELYQVELSVPEVATFYKTELAKRGWQLSKEESLPNQNYCLVFHRANTLTASIWLNGKQSNGQWENGTSIIVDTAPYRIRSWPCQ